MRGDEVESVKPVAVHRGRWILLTVPLAMFLALASWAIASPVGSSPDDDYHMASIWCAQGPREGLCGQGDTADERRVPEQVLEASQCYSFDATQAASCPQSDADDFVESDRGNFRGDYPPLYYLALSPFASPDVSFSVIVMRLVNAAVFVGLLTLAFGLVGRSLRGALLWGTAAAMVPLGMFLVASVNPSSWAITSAIITWLAVTAYFREDDRRRRIALIALALVGTIIGAGARGDSAVYSGLAIVVGTVLAFSPTRRFLRAAAAPALLVVVALIFFFASGHANAANPTTLADDGASAGEVWGLTLTNLTLLPQLWTGALGTAGLGWLDTFLPPLVWVPAIATYAAVLFWGLQQVGRRKGIALALVAASLVAIPMYILVHDQVYVGTYVQPRYVYPLMLILIMVSLTGLRRVELSTPQRWALVAALSIANGAALHTNLRRYVTGTDVGGANLESSIEWWWGLPFGPNVVWLAGTVAFSVSLIALAIWWGTQHTDRTRDAEPEIEPKVTA
ncbi:DUF2142 domain-containing protein [Diaminobutyricimonas aerilata]|uniref:DUF2142 domain-containing protein n=1 Tax=Diaminobutyricimonas aerilata TaxID=1162967 RepID=UPI0012FD25D9|nr:DUF2142 domain-containing protein [Diaminobutyricimonas aerilata]